MIHSTRGETEEMLSAQRIVIPDFTISWAGENSWNPGFCFGSNDGRIKYTAIDGALGDAPIQVVDSGEAINGVAFTSNLMAVSTRADVAIFQFLNPADIRRASYNAGAHDIIACGPSHFIAPAGIEGLIVFDPRPSGVKPVRRTAKGKTLNFYTATNLGRCADGEVVCCAVRKEGLATTVVSQSRDSDFMLRTSRDIDIVDVCPLNAEKFPYAAIALGRNRSLHLIQDIFSSDSVTLRFDRMQGTAHKILCANDHLVLLTSKRVYILADLVQRFLEQERVDQWTNVRELVLEAVDILISHGHLLIIMPDYVIQMPMVLHRASDVAENSWTPSSSAQLFETHSIDSISGPWLADPNQSAAAAWQSITLR